MMSSTAASSAARALRAIPSAARSETSRQNGRKRKPEFPYEARVFGPSKPEFGDVAGQVACIDDGAEIARTILTLGQTLAIFRAGCSKPTAAWMWRHLDGKVERIAV